MDRGQDVALVLEIGQRSTGPADTVPPLQHLLSAYSACFAQQNHRHHTALTNFVEAVSKILKVNSTFNGIFMISNSRGSGFPKI
jgi:hypothetical protein